MGYCWACFLPLISFSTCFTHNFHNNNSKFLYTHGGIMGGGEGACKKEQIGVKICHLKTPKKIKKCNLYNEVL